MGDDASSNFPYFGANFWEDWERPIHFEILEEDLSGYSANAGVKILVDGVVDKIKNHYLFLLAANTDTVALNILYSQIVKYRLMNLLF